MQSLLSNRSRPIPPPSIITASCSSSTSGLAPGADKLILAHRETILFSTYAKRDMNNDWTIYARGCAFSHNSTAARRSFLESITKKIAAGKPTDARLRERIKYFVANRKAHQEFRIEATGVLTDTVTCSNQSELEEQDSPDRLDSASSTSSSVSDAVSLLEPLLTDRRDSDDSGFHEPRKHSVTEESVSDDERGRDGLNDIPLCRPKNPMGRTRSLLSPRSHTSEEHFDWNESTVQSTLSSTCSTLVPTSPVANGVYGTVVKTDKNGFFSAHFTLPKEQVEAWTGQTSPRQVQIACISNSGKFETSYCPVNLVESHGISIISDIDDTIKCTGILSGARKVLSNTFFKKPKAVKGMPEAYTTWHKLGASFHYVSNSPFQLNRLLTDFLSANGFPPGSMHLREEGSLLARLVETPGKAKRDAILRIMEEFPKRQFILVGDSGEIDLEIYTRIAKDYPDRILKIFVRDVTTPHENKLATKARKAVSDPLPTQILRRASLFRRRRSSQTTESVEVVSPLGVSKSALEMLVSGPAITCHAMPTASLSSSCSSTTSTISTTSTSLSKASIHPTILQRWRDAQKQCETDVAVFTDADYLLEGNKIRDALWAYLTSL